MWKLVTYGALSKRPPGPYVARFPKAMLNHFTYATPT